MKEVKKMKYTAFYVEVDGKIKYVNSIEEHRQGWAQKINFKLFDNYSGNNFDSEFLSNQQAHRVAKAVKRTLRKYYSKVKFYAVVEDNAQMEL